MINKSNFMPCNTLEYPTTYYRFDNKNYSPEAWTKKMHNEGYRRSETVAGVVSWSRTVSPCQRLPKDSPYASMAIFPADNSRHLNSTRSTRVSKNNLHSRPLESKKSGLHAFHRGQVTALQQSHFTPFQGKGQRLSQASAPVVDWDKARLKYWDKQQETINKINSGTNAALAGRSSKNNLSTRSLQDAKFNEVFYDCDSVEAFYDCQPEVSLDRRAVNPPAADRYQNASHELYQMISTTPALRLFRQKNDLLEKITAEDYLAVSYLIKKLAALAPKSAVTVQKSYDNLLQQAGQKIKTAQEIAQATLRINPLYLAAVPELHKHTVVSPGRPEVVKVNYREGQARLTKQYLARRLPGDSRNAL